MELRIALIFAVISVAWVLASCTPHPPAATMTASSDEVGFYSREAREADVQFSAVFFTSFRSVDDFKANLEVNVATLEKSNVYRLMSFLMGPLVNRGIGSVRSFSIKVDADSAALTDSGLVSVRYTYSGKWILRNSIQTGKTQIPVPYSYTLIKTPNWIACTDKEPQHQTDSFYFYFWDPRRTGCDQQVGVNYQSVDVTFKEIKNQKLSYPEYPKLLNSGNQKKNLQMTFAFGYIKDVENPDPFKDSDQNIKNFREFLGRVRYMAQIMDYKETPILQSEYLNPVRPEAQIGSRFVGFRNGIRFEIKVIAAAQIDQMDLFAKSFAHDHDAFFGWFGHSRVGSEIDLINFRYMVEDKPEYYSITPQYQVVYWAGCTSYTYYVNPLLQMKSAINPQDPKGTRGLDILTNGFSSPFTPYPSNALVWLGALTNWDMKTSYQKIINDLEQASTNLRRTVLVNVIGDEDNPR